ncbi:hypothetical protein E2562_018367 [Oryza meyeriana var. granulata]|uniref:Uncharacterized protein n=1 Tax=Oryza meyeriana var. granulata TaxID=110450 RepID=A0A6G1D3V3_9ORYZ|nr:hypothetical protein E2562_018367 [Oryza meyeriana var. granulata]
MEEWDLEEDDLRSVGLVGVYRHCFRVARARGRIALVHGLPLAVLFLAHVAITYAIFSRMRSDEATFEHAPAGSGSETLLYFVRGIADWYDDLYLRRVIRAFPVVWMRRLMKTFVAAFVVLLLYNGVFTTAILLAILRLYRHATLLTSLALLGGAAYLAGLVYIGVVWHLASVVSVLEDAYGVAAMRRSRALLAGKLWTVAVIFAKLSGLSFAVEMAFKAVVVEDTMRLGLGYRVLFGLAMAAALCAVIMVALVAQAVVYFVCKSYHGESVDRSHLSDHLGAYLGEYQPLDNNNDSNGGGGVQLGVQMEQLQ